MTPDQIEQLARAAGATHELLYDESMEGGYYFVGDGDLVDEYPSLTRFAELVAGAERERIAQMLDAEHENRKHLDNHAAFYARMIRELKGQG